MQSHASDYWKSDSVTIRVQTAACGNIAAQMSIAALPERQAYPFWTLTFACQIGTRSKRAFLTVQSG